MFGTQNTVLVDLPGSFDPSKENSRTHGRQFEVVAAVQTDEAGSGHGADASGGVVRDALLVDGAETAGEEERPAHLSARVRCCKGNTQQGCGRRLWALCIFRHRKH